MTKVIRLGVTGLRRSGKTVFLTGLIYQLTELGSKYLEAFANKGVSLRLARLDHVGVLPRFPYEVNLQNLRREEPFWPVPTIGESACRLEFSYLAPRHGLLDRIKPWFGLEPGVGRIRLHLHDYPGEYLLDVEMLGMSFSQWSLSVIARMMKQRPEETQAYLTTAEKLLSETGASQQVRDESLAPLRRRYVNFILSAREAGLEMIQPAMRLAKWNELYKNPEELRGADPGAEILPFLPLPHPAEDAKKGLLWKQMENKYKKHRREVSAFRKRLARSNAQIVLTDVLRVLRHGVESFDDARSAVNSIVKAYRYGGWLPRFSGGIRRVVFAGTKADHAGRSSRANLEKLLEELVNKAVGRLPPHIKQIHYEWFTTLRATQDVKPCDPQMSGDMLCGVMRENTAHRSTESIPKNWTCPKLPEQWPNDRWNIKDYAFRDFEPRPMYPRDGAPLEHINIDRIIWRLLEPWF